MPGRADVVEMWRAATTRLPSSEIQLSFCAACGRVQWWFDRDWFEWRLYAREDGQPVDLCPSCAPSVVDE
jgi:hypothetical protein